MYTLQIKTKTQCPICRCKSDRVKSIQVNADTVDEAKKEANQEFLKWVESLKGKKCRICQSIINDVK